MIHGTYMYDTTYSKILQLSIGSRYIDREIGSGHAKEKREEKREITPMRKERGRLRKERERL